MENTKTTKSGATLIRVDGTTTQVFPAKKRFTLKELYSFICAGDSRPIVQAVPLIGENLDLWCHEEGKLRNLPVNRAATELYGRYLTPGDFLVGDVLIMSDKG